MGIHVELWLSVAGGALALLFGVQRIVRGEITAITNPMQVRLDGVEKDIDRHETELRDLRRST